MGIAGWEWGDPPKKNWGGLSIPTTRHPAGLWEQQGWAELPEGDSEVWGALCWGGVEAGLGMSQSEFNRALTWLLRHRCVPELAGAWSKEGQ